MAGSPFGAQRITVKPPERGVFALDHDGECKSEMKAFLGCLKQNDNDHFPCKALSKSYLQCRMDRDLMAKEELDNLGLGEMGEYKRVDSKIGEREQAGFVAGSGVKPGKKGIFW